MGSAIASLASVQLALRSSVKTSDMPIKPLSRNRDT